MLNNIKALREARKLTLRELADRVHIADSAISRMENGTQNIYLHQAIAFAEVFKVSLDDVANRVFLHDTKTVYIEKEINYQTMIAKMPMLSNLELARIMGAIEMIMQQRNGNGSPQSIKNGIDKIIQEVKK